MVMLQANPDALHSSTHSLPHKKRRTDEMSPSDSLFVLSEEEVGKLAKAAIEAKARAYCKLSLSFSFPGRSAVLRVALVELARAARTTIMIQHGWQHLSKLPLDRGLTLSDLYLRFPYVYRPLLEFPGGSRGSACDRPNRYRSKR